MLAKESGHFYQRDGAPAYEVPNKSRGGMRPTRVTDAKKLDLVPSVTTVMKVLAQPGLENWKVDQGIWAALTLPRLKGENDEAFMARVKHDSKQQAIKAAEFGTRIHGAIEQHYAGQPPSDDCWPFVKGVAAVIENFCGPQEWITERTFASPLGYGGCADLYCDDWLLDFKGKDGHLEKEKTWDEHAMQLAAYRKGLELDCRCAIVFFSRTDPGVAKFCEIGEPELERGWTMFDCALHLWRAQKKFTHNTTGVATE